VLTIFKNLPARYNRRITPAYEAVVQRCEQFVNDTAIASAVQDENVAVHPESLWAAF
jgi:hypothetical protein